jgi:hypothetical protein
MRQFFANCVIPISSKANAAAASFATYAVGLGLAPTPSPVIISLNPAYFVELLNLPTHCGTVLDLEHRERQLSTSQSWFGISRGAVICTVFIVIQTRCRAHLLTWKECRGLIEDLASFEVPGTGGEPLIHRSFFEIASYAREHGLRLT